MDDAALDDDGGGQSSDANGGKINGKRPNSSEEATPSKSPRKRVKVEDKVKMQRTQSSRLDDAAIEAAVAVAVQLTCNSASAEQILQVSHVVVGIVLFVGPFVVLIHFRYAGASGW